MRMARALDGLTAPTGSGADDDAGSDTEASVGLVDALGDIKLRVWAELGRPSCRSATHSGLPLGAVVELDHGADSPVDLFVNGVRFARGHLIVTDDGEWAFALDEVERNAGAPGRPPPRPFPIPNQKEHSPDGPCTRSRRRRVHAQGGQRRARLRRPRRDRRGRERLDAITRFQELRPELTMLDITMPEKDGLQALAEIMAIDPDAPRYDVLRARTGDAR